MLFFVLSGYLSWRWIERPAQDWSRRAAALGSARRGAALHRASAGAAT